MPLDRKKNNFINKWWWSVDRYLVIAFASLIGIGMILVMAASPAVAERIGLESFYFIKRQIVFVLMALPVIFIISIMPVAGIRRLAIMGYAACIILLLVVPFVGMEIKGAKRWLNFAGFSMQPSEFMKTFFVVLTAWVLSKKYETLKFKGFEVVFGIYVLFVMLLLMQPDFGMTVTVSAVWIGQLFISGLSIIFFFGAAIIGVLGIISAYFVFPHVAKRINNFVDPSSGDTYQVTKSLQAFSNGGIFGRGPGQGVVKEQLPDSHTDFIFAVAAEEMGMITCLLIISIFAFIIIRGFIRISNEEDKFIIFAVSGLLMQIGIQAIINMSVSLHLMPTKGMTLPFISYGGSSMISAALAVGIIIALTKKRYGVGNLVIRSSSLRINKAVTR